MKTERGEPYLVKYSHVDAFSPVKEKRKNERRHGHRKEGREDKAEGRGGTRGAGDIKEITTIPLPIFFFSILFLLLSSLLLTFSSPFLSLLLLLPLCPSHSPLLPLPYVAAVCTHGFNSTLATPLIQGCAPGHSLAARTSPCAFFPCNSINSHTINVSFTGLLRAFFPLPVARLLLDICISRGTHQRRPVEC